MPLFTRSARFDGRTLRWALVLGGVVVGAAAAPVPVPWPSKDCREAYTRTESIHRAAMIPGWHQAEAAS